MHTPKILGILNVTPDSFSDGGQYLGHQDAIKHAHLMMQHGADIIDVGAESTRPGAATITAQEEIARLEQILPYLKGYRVSLDSRNPETIRRFIDYIDIINDVTGAISSEICDLALRHNKTLIFMHSLSVPVKREEYVQTDNIITYLQEWQGMQVARLLAMGFVKEQLVFDPGIGFGKSAQQSLEIIKNADKLRLYDVPILIGHSRKSFLGAKTLQQKDAETHSITVNLARMHVDYMRVHDVLGAKKALVGIMESVI